MSKKTKLHDGDALVKKPWGQYEDIYRASNVVFKKITINPGQEFSLQTHKLRDESWLVSSGTGEVRVGTEVIFTRAGNTFFIGKEVRHQVKNTGTVNMEIYEMQMGVCKEDDIVRYKDKYGRG